MLEIKISKKEHNKLFPNRKYKWYSRYKIFDDTQKRELEMYHYINLLGKILYTLTFPVLVLIAGVPNTLRAVKDVWSGKDIGGDTVNKEWFYSKVSKYKVKEL